MMKWAVVKDLTSNDVKVLGIHDANDDIEFLQDSNIEINGCYVAIVPTSAKLGDIFTKFGTFDVYTKQDKDI